MNGFIFRRYYTLIFSLLLSILFVQFSYAQNNRTDTGFQDYQVQFNSQDLVLTYGEYSEVEFFVESSDQLNFSIEETKPIGMSLTPLADNSVLLAGLPEFVGKYCFLLKVSDQDQSKQALKRVCLHSENNEKLDHPQFKTKSIISIQKNNHEVIDIKLTNEFSHLTPEFIQGNIPDGMNSNSQRGGFTISGSTSFDGVFDFLLLAKQMQNGQEFYVYKQFQVEVKPDVVNRYQCDTGYYFDETLGYCVQNSGDLCPSGTFYDSENNSCVNYQRAPHMSCGPNSYYDHFLYRCVRNSYQRCPYNYEYDPYYGRCVRLPQTCSIGYRYSYRYQSCIYVGYRRCARGSHYSSYANRCVRNYAYCRAGHYWNGYTCRTTQRYCGNGRYWSPNFRSCRSTNQYRTCRGGYRYDYGRSRCVRRNIYANRSCRGGLRYSPRRNRCVNYRHVNQRPNRRVNRPTRRRPVVVRPHRPTHRPNRPTTRPNRPTTRPNRPTTRPNRPTTRPNRPTTRPNRPTTRPNRPTTRPNRPTTRPNRPTTRPNRPTTRPNRPTTRPNRPTTRPNRPTTRPNRPTTRPNRPTTRPNRPTTRPNRPTTRPNRPTTRPNRPTTRPNRSRPTTRPNRSSNRGSTARAGRSRGSSSRNRSGGSRGRSGRPRRN